MENGPFEDAFPIENGHEMRFVFQNHLFPTWASEGFSPHLAFRGGSLDPP